MGSKKNVLVTGSSAGIGLAISLALAKSDFNVLGGVRKKEDGEKIQQQSDGKIIPVQLDVTSEENRESVKKLIETEYGGELYSLVNNAGILDVAPIELGDMEEFRRQMEVNALGPLALTQKVLPFIRKTKGRIINISSMNGKVSMPAVGGYSASKFAVEAYSDALRMELAASGAKVIIVEAGQIKTEIFKKSLVAYEKFLERVTPEQREVYGALLDGGKAAIHAGMNSPKAPEEIADVVLQALSSEVTKTHYVVGEDAQGLIDAKSALSVEEVDREILKFFGL